jgi:predicted methyltransferase
VLPKGQHRIRHYGLLANGNRNNNIAKARELLNVPKPEAKRDSADVSDKVDDTHSHTCPCCGGRMIIIESFEGSCKPRPKPSANSPEGIDSS